MSYSKFNLSLNSTLKDLESQEFAVEIHCSCGNVYKAFENSSILTGVILKDNHSFIGAISRSKFLEKMSRPYSLELFFHRAILNLYKAIKSEALVLAEDTPILEGVQLALTRNSEFLYEPIVVQAQNDEYKLLDMQKLLMAQAQIHELAANLLKQTTQELEAANSELLKLAHLDGLTQISNRRRFDEYLNVQWFKLALLQKPLAILLCDVDYFKAYNDCYGHQAGDKCLQIIAQILEKTVSDPEHLVARYGGEEFAVILPRYTTVAAEKVAEEIGEKVRSRQIPHQASPVAGCVTVSIGVASWIPDGSASSLDLVMQADQLLYKAKSTGRDRVAV